MTPAGAVRCWGVNDHGQAGNHSGPYTAISAGVDHACALTTSGAAECWGDNTSGQATGQPGPYTAISVGALHSCALTAAGAIDCWGDNTYGEGTSQPGPYGVATFLTITDASIVEPDAGRVPLAFVIGLNTTNTTGADICVDYRTQAQTARPGQDFVGGGTRTACIAPGRKTKTITIGVLGDTVTEPTEETFRVNLSNPVGAVLSAASQGHATITDND